MVAEVGAGTAVAFGGVEALVGDGEEAGGTPVHLIGGAFEAKELDAKHAIKQGAELAAGI